jgi:hypothetical protein
MSVHSYWQELGEILQYYYIELIFSFMEAACVGQAAFKCFYE